MKIINTSGLIDNVQNTSNFLLNKTSYRMHYSIDYNILYNILYNLLNSNIAYMDMLYIHIL